MKKTATNKTKSQAQAEARFVELCAQIAAFGDMLKNDAEHRFEIGDVNWAHVVTAEYVVGTLEQVALAMVKTRRFSMYAEGTRETITGRKAESL